MPGEPGAGAAPSWDAVPAARTPEDPPLTGRMGEPLVKVVGGKTAVLLEEKLGLRTVGDLLRHYPRDRRRRGQLTDLRSLETDEHVTVLARVASLKSRPMKQKSGFIADVTVTDGASDLRLAFFPRGRGPLALLHRQLAVGATALFSGKVSQYRGVTQLVHPQYELLGAGGRSVEDVGPTDALPGTVPDAPADAPLDPGEALAAVDAYVNGVVPIYAAAAGIQSWTVARAVRLVLDGLAPEDVPDPLPAEVLEQHVFPSLHEALRRVHSTEVGAGEEAALERLRYEEAFVLQAELARRRLRTDAETAVPRPPREDGLRAAFDARLPFTLTEGQRRVGEQLAADLSRPHPMNRLLQGEVGSGKTVVALRAMLAVVDAGGQAALLAPTEVLAAQHHRTLERMLGDLAGGGTLGAAEGATRVVLLTGSLGARARREAMLAAASGEVGIVVGTHALLEERVQVAELGLVVVDEQHRFGVEQRDRLRAKASAVPHLLVMTATPIPRTVAMTSFGDLETSVLRELPAGRSPIATHVVPTGKEAWVGRMFARLREEVDAGHQVYVVCPSIGDEDGLASGVDTPEARRTDTTADGRVLTSAVRAELLLREVPALADVRRALLHGRLPPDDKDAVMQAFSRGEVDVLVSTTVVEVGVDVPEATAMVVMDADRFGISQLHQLRGRVGRGGHPGTCFLVTQLPAGHPGVARLQDVAATTDGFALAQLDVETRGEGDVLGARQSGVRSSLRLLRVVRDVEVIEAARADATRVVAADPDLRHHPALAGAIGELLRPQHEDFLERA